ncbi:MAG: BrnT family toxin [Magnetococcales bacterium]|nr:BrnT family toxin [Magnetococcales bacterium]MBF0149609.1 BrnT family toxin [Magnetococcales bacterium]
MKIEFDPKKNLRNIQERGLSFEEVVRFDFSTASFIIDTRRDYGEMRHVAVGYLGDRLHVLCFVETGEGIRVISFRKANAREAKRYGKSQTIDR